MEISRVGQEYTNMHAACGPPFDTLYNSNNQIGSLRSFSMVVKVKSQFSK